MNVRSGCKTFYIGNCVRNGDLKLETHGTITESKEHWSRRNVRFLWDSSIQTNKELENNTPYITVVDKEKRNC